MINKNITTIVFIITLAVVLVGIGWYYFAAQKEVEESPAISNETPSPSTQATTTSETKLYRNEEWGFEFEYPEKWVINREHKSLTYYSKFFLEMSLPVIIDDVDKEEKFDSTFLVNIVLPEFIRGFNNLEKTSSDITVAGVQGIKYEYKYQGFSHTAVILPFGQYKMILATGNGSKQYLDEFNQILASFKFLR